MFGLRKVTARVADHAQHVVNVCESLRGFEHLSQGRLGLVEFALLVVLAAEQQPLLRMLIHLLCPDSPPACASDVRGLANPAGTPGRELTTRMGTRERESVNAPSSERRRLASAGRTR